MPSSLNSSLAANTRRDFLTSTASGLGMMGLGAMLAQDGVLSTGSAMGAETAPAINPLAPKQPHFKPKAKACIFIFMAGAPVRLIYSIPSPNSTR